MRSEEALSAIVSFLVWKSQEGHPNAELLDARGLTLPFYGAHELVELLIVPEPGREPRIMCLLVGSENAITLDGKSSRIQFNNATDAETLKTLTQDGAAAYLRLCCAAVCGGDGPFRIIDAFDPALLSEAPTAEDEERFSELIEPLAHEGEETDHHLYSATVKYADSLFRAHFQVDRSGNASMTDDDPLAGGIPWRREGFEDLFRIEE